METTVETTMIHEAMSFGYADASTGERLSAAQRLSAEGKLVLGGTDKDRRVAGKPMRWYRVPDAGVALQAMLGPRIGVVGVSALLEDLTARRRSCLTLDERVSQVACDYVAATLKLSVFLVTFRDLCPEPGEAPSTFTREVPAVDAADARKQAEDWCADVADSEVVEVEPSGRPS